MIFRRTLQFLEDYQKLEEDDRIAVHDAFEKVALALKGNTDLYNQYRIKAMQGKPGIWEGHIKQNLVFTFHYEYTNDGEKVCFFRRIGMHKVYEKP